jgi:hypothetical protein
MKITRFEDIAAWQEARNLVKMVYGVINRYPKFRVPSIFSNCQRFLR